MAFAVTTSKGTTLIHATGDTIPEANRELFVFEKVNGEWKIARYMFNKTEPGKIKKLAASLYEVTSGLGANSSRFFHFKK
ncbi:MAG: hypothetical protein R3C61_16075 [Bacteroidia bacterium]